MDVTPEALTEFYGMPKEVAPLITELVTKTDCLKDMIARADLIWARGPSRPGEHEIRLRRAHKSPSWSSAPPGKEF